MHTKILKCVSVAALLLAMVCWPASSNYQRELNLVVSVAAVLVFVQAYQAKKYQWAAGFLAIALLFNPVYPLFGLAGMLGLALLVATIAPFALSLAALRPSPVLSIPSITDRTPGSQSL